MSEACRVGGSSLRGSLSFCYMLGNESTRALYWDGTKERGGSLETKQATYLDFLGTPRVRMAIPVFQRVYTWGVWQCEELLEDIMRAGADGEDHFIGSLVYTRDEADGSEGYDAFYNIVDGQQRTTTVNLLLIALRDFLRERDGEVCGGEVGKAGEVCGVDADAIEARFLYLETPEGGRVRKFIAAPADAETFQSVLEKTSLPVSYLTSEAVLANYRYFMSELERGLNLDALWRGLGCLLAIVVELGAEDNPQLIFEGINSKGLSLASSDLLRNKLFYGNDEAEQENLLGTYWEPLEALFADDPDQKQFNAALRYWLCEQDPELERHTTYELYSVFRKFINERYEGTTEELMRELLEACTYFKSMIKSPPMQKHLVWAEGETSVGFVLKV